MTVIRDPQARCILSLLRYVSIRRKNKQKEFIALVHPCIHKQYDVILHTDEHKRGSFILFSSNLIGKMLVQSSFHLILNFIGIMFSTNQGKK